jgi:hypothetical protein
MPPMYTRDVHRNLALPVPAAICAATVTRWHFKPLAYQTVDACRLAGSIWSKQAQELALRHAKPAVSNCHKLLWLLLLSA